MSDGERITIYLNKEDKERFVRFMQKMNLGNTLKSGNKSKAVKLAIDLAFSKLRDIDSVLQELDPNIRELYLKTFDPIEKK